MTIPEPPARLSPPNTFTLSEGTVIERLHRRDHLGEAFNPGLGDPTRFAPIDDVGGRTVPTLYAADTLEAAVRETVFHDVIAGAETKEVSIHHIEMYMHTRLEASRDMTLASLRGADLMKWGIERNDLITTRPKFYRSTAEWAKAIHHRFEDVEGLVWTSNRCDPDTAYLFFGDRVGPGDFNIVETRDGRTDKTVLRDVRRFGKRSDIGIMPVGVP